MNMVKLGPSYRYFYKALKNISEIKEYEDFIKKNDKQHKVALIVDNTMHNTKGNKNNKKHLFNGLH